MMLRGSFHERKLGLQIHLGEKQAACDAVTELLQPDGMLLLWNSELGLWMIPSFSWEAICRSHQRLSHSYCNIRAFRRRSFVLSTGNNRLYGKFCELRCV